MTKLNLFATLALLLAMGPGMACRKPQPPVAPTPVEPSQDDLDRAEREARERAEREAREAAERMRLAAQSVLVDVNFEYNKADIRRVDTDKLHAIADFMRAFPQARLRIDGHCDERGTYEYNMALGERRAFATKNYLAGLGVAESRFTTQSYGKERPKVTGSNERSWLANRRCEFYLN